MRSANLIFRIDRIDDLAAHVAGDPDFVDLDFLVGVYMKLDNLRKITAMRKWEGDAHGAALWKSALAPVGFLRAEFQDALHASTVEIDIARLARGRCAGHAWTTEKIQPVLDE